MLLLSSALAGLLLALPPAQDPAKPPAADAGARYDDLEREFQRAQEEYYAPFEKARTDEERQKIRLDPEREPTRVFVPRFQDLARSAKGQDAGARALLWIVENSRGDDPKLLESAVDELVSDYKDSPRLARLAQSIQWGAEIGTARALEVLDRVAKASPHADVRAACLFVSGVLRMRESPDSAAEARALLQRVTKEHAGTTWAEQAEAFLFELDHLQVGMVAPDFQAADEKDAPYRLSDYRGKVVVLDFWGFW